MYKISIIVPIYNKEKYIRECLDSILSQSLKDIEIVCINDGSTDNSLLILQQYANDHDNIMLINQANRGVGYSRNLGIQKSSGEYVAFMDPDDMYPDDGVLLDLYNAATSSNLPIAGGSFSSFKPDGTEILSYTGDNAGYTFLSDGVMNYSDYQFDYGFQRFIFKISFLHENKLLFPNYIRFQDPPFLTSVLTVAKTFYALSRITYRYRESYATIHWTIVSKYDMIRGLEYNLTLSNKNQFDKLHLLTYRRLSSDYRASIILTNNTAFESRILLSALRECRKKLNPNLDNFALDAIITRLESQCSINTQKPVISIIVPVFNVSNYLEQCLDSILAQQDVTDYEVILVDDGSTDNSGAICDKYSEADSRFKTIHKDNGGLSSARNAGADVATGKILYFLDSDDYIDKNALKTMISEINENNLDLLCFDAETFFDTEQDRLANAGYLNYYSKRLDDTKVTTGKELLSQFRNAHGYRTPVQLLAISHEFYRKNGLSCYFGILHEDNLFTFQALLLANRAKYLDQTLYYRRIRGGSIMTAKKTHKNLEGYRRCLLEMVEFMLLHEDSVSSGRGVFEDTKKSALFVWEKLDNVEKARMTPLSLIDSMKVLRYDIPSTILHSALMSVYVLPKNNDVRLCINHISHQKCPVNCFIVESEQSIETDYTIVDQIPYKSDSNRIITILNGDYAITDYLLLDLAIDLFIKNESKAIVMSGGSIILTMYNRLHPNAQPWDVSNKYIHCFTETSTSTIIQQGDSIISSSKNSDEPLYNTVGITQDDLKTSNSESLFTKFQRNRRKIGTINTIRKGWNMWRKGQL